jgi:3-hydroxyisobutyrate dehydrogenase-like beta-hydroxyacid dehydrogenase
MGIMGSRMAANLRRAGFDVVVWNRTRERAEEVAREHGAQLAGSPAEAAEAADILITMLVDAPQVEEVLFGGEAPAAPALREGALAIDMSTTAPGASRAIAGRVRDHGVRFLDAPVTGSKPKAEEGTLTIIAGGETGDVEEARPLFEAMGTVIVHVGPQGHGQVAKLLNNTLAAVNAAALAEALTIGRAGDLDLDALVEVIGAGSGASLMLDLKAGPMRAHDFTPLFRLAHILKDVRHCLDEAAAQGAEFRLGREAERLYAAADDAGRGQDDFAAVIEVPEAAAGLTDG